jgi:drug/metabolite transporter (DMT)-like permease
VINVTAGIMFFNEQINWKESLGMIITIAGIMWISLSRGQSSYSATTSMDQLSDDSQYYKFMAILAALSVGGLNASQTV